MTFEFFKYIVVFTATLLAIIRFIDKRNGNKRSLVNIKKRFEIYEKIIMNADNKVLSYTLLREYLGCPISDGMIAFILKSTRFYDFVTVWKNIYPLITYNPETQKIEYRNNRKPRKCIFAIFYFIFLLPLLAFLFLFTERLIPNGFSIPSFMIAVAFAIPAIFFFQNEYWDRVLAIKLMESLEKENTPSTATCAHSETCANNTP